jgi:hypothetical protein
MAPDTWTVTRIGSRSVGEKTEAELLLGFVKSLPVDGRGTGPILVTFGGNGFDLPLLRYRAFALGVPLPGLHGAGHRNYWHRFGSDHIDLCDVLSGYGGSTKPSLAEMAALANIPVKIGGLRGGRSVERSGGLLPDRCSRYFLRVSPLRDGARRVEAGLFRCFHGQPNGDRSETSRAVAVVVGVPSCVMSAGSNGSAEPQPAAAANAPSGGGSAPISVADATAPRRHSVALADDKEAR